MPTTAPTAFQKTAETFTPNARTLAQKYFVSPEIFREEQEKIFSRRWSLAGHQSQIAASGDYFLTAVADESLIVVRGRKSEIRGFYNVCRHRGSRLCEHRAGEAANGHLSAAIQCPYHAWTYGLDGRLIGAPHMDEVPGFDKADYSLRPVDLALWEGFIFVNLTDGPMPMEKWFEPLAKKFSRWNLPTLRSAKRIEYDVRANWKLIFENYSECYHCLGVHPMLSKVSPYDSAENDLTDGPFLGGFMKMNKGKSLTMSGNACALPIDSIPAGADHARLVFYYSIFPNMLLSIHPEYVMVHQLRPKAPDRTLVYCDWLFHPEAEKAGVNDPSSPGRAFDWTGISPYHPDDAIEFWDMTNKQDWHVCELSQQGIASRGYEPGPYSARESIPAAWDRYYLKVMSQR